MSAKIQEEVGVERNDQELVNNKKCMKLNSEQSLSQENLESLVKVSLGRPTCSSSKNPKNKIYKNDAKSWRLKRSNVKIGIRKQIKRSKSLKKSKHPKKMFSRLNKPAKRKVLNNLEPEIEILDIKSEESLKMIDCDAGSEVLKDADRVIEPETLPTDAKPSDFTLFETDSSDHGSDNCLSNKKRKSPPVHHETSKKKCTESNKTLDESIKNEDRAKSPIFMPSLQPWLKTFSAWSHNERIQAIDSLITQATSSEVRHMMKTIEPLFQRDFIALLPREIALTLLKYLSAKDLRVAAQTCRYWRMMCDDNLLWKEQCRRIGITSLSNNRYATCSSPFKTAYLHQYKIEKRWMTIPVDKPIVMKGHDDHVITCLQFFGNRILSGSDDTTLKVWSATTGRCIRTLSGHTGGVWSSQMVGRLVVSGSTDRTLKIWDATIGKCLQTLSGHTSTVRCMHMHGNVVVSGSRDATLRVWSLDTGRCLRVLVGHLAAVRCVQYDGKYVVSGAYDYFVKVWNPLTGECVHTLSGHTNRVYSLQFDGTHIVSGSLDTSIRVWDVESGQLKHTLVGHQSLTSGMELDNNILVSGNADSTVKVWDITTGLCIHTLSGANKHQSAVTCLQATKRFVITSSDDGTVKLWDLRTGEFIRNLVELGSGGSGGVIWRIKASQSKLICAVGSRNGTEETKLLVLDFEIPEVCFKCQH